MASLEQCLREGTAHLDRGVTVEEQGGLASEAMVHYWQAIASFERGKLLPGGSQAQRDRVEALLLHARDRVQFLSKRPADPPPYSAAPGPAPPPAKPPRSNTAAMATAASAPRPPQQQQQQQYAAVATPTATGPSPPAAAASPMGAFMAALFGTPARPRPAPPPTGAVGPSLSALWQENLTDPGYVSSAEERAEAVRFHQNAAESVMRANGSTTATEPNLGLPPSLQGWMDLAVEASLLPKPGLHVGPGARPPAQGGPQVRQPTPAPRPLPMAGQGATPQFSFSQAFRSGQSFTKLLANEPQQKWLRIKWLSTAEAAATARQTGKPLFIELVAGRYGKADAAVCCLGGRLMRAGGLSDDRVIEIINEFYVATAVNVTRDGFPAHDIPALAYVQQVFASNWRFEFGFGSCFAVDDSGHIPLGMPGPKGDMDDNFGAGRYVDFLIQALERHKQLKNVRGAFMRGDMAGGIAGAQALTADLIATMQRSAVANAALANTLQSNVPADFASQRDR